MNEVTTFERNLAAPVIQSRIESALPAHVSVKKFSRTLASAAMSNPMIASARFDSVINEVMKAASDGLVIDGKEAALVCYNSHKGVVVSYLPMVAGVMKQIRQDKTVRNIVAEVVHKNDHFKYEIGSGTFEHEPNWFSSDRGDVVGAYCMITRTDGTRQVEIMNRDQLNEVRSCAKSKNIWDTWFTEMCRKSVIHRISKYAQVGHEIVEHDHNVYDMEKKQPESRMIDINEELGLD